MKTKLSLILASLAMAFSAGAGVAATNKDISNADAADVDYSTCETYYNAKNKTSLFSAVRTVAKQNRKSLTGDSAYKNLWEIYKTAYVKSNGKMFDYYSSVSNFTPGTDQAGNYSGEGDVYNREHCIPKSWWGGAETNQGADAFIVVPTDGYVNSIRSNLPFGYVSSATYESGGGFSKKGSGKSAYGYTGTVFEPDDSVKGDFARIYYYAIVGWDNSYDWDTDEGSVCFEGTYDTTNHGLTDYSIKLLSEWSKLDPVSDWERSVNTKVKAAQGNVNPFIDHPEYADVIWKDATGYTKYANDTGITSISMTSATLAEGETATISAVSSNSGTISWSSDEETVATVSDSSAASGADVTITAVGEGTANITASVTISGKTYSATCVVTVTSSGGGEETDSYQIVNTDFDTSYTSDAERTVASGLKIHAYNVMNNNIIQFKRNGGYIYNSDSLALGQLTISGISGSLTVYAGSTMNPESNTISGSNGVYDLTGYTYFKVINSSNNAATCSSITVGISQSSKTLSSISIETAPNKVAYTEGENFDPTGLVIRRTYSDSSYDTYTYANHNSEFSFDPALTDSLTTTDTSVTITYSQKTCSQTITVNSSGGGSSGSYTIKYDDTFNPTLPTASGDVHTSATLCVDKTASNLSFMEAGIYKGSSSDYIMFAQNSGFIYNTDSLGTIDSISITYSGSTSTSGKIGVYFGSSVLSTYTTTSNTTIAGQSKTDNFVNSTDNYGYFQISTSNRNVQITTIVIEYHESSTPVTSFSLTYSQNTSDDVTGMPTPNPVTGITAGSDVTLSDAVPLRSGYTFKGWAETAEGTTYITEIQNIQSNKFVYAIWEENVSPTPSSGAVNYYKLSSTDSITSGRYVIALYNGTSYYAMTRTINSSKYPLSSVISVTDDCILSANGSEYEFEIEVSQSGIAIKNPSTSKYVKYSSSTNLAEQTDAYYWTQGTAVKGTFRFNSQTDGRLLAGRTGTTNVFGGYASSNITSSGTEYYDIELFRGYTAEDYATEFNSNITCDVQGSSTPSFGTGYSWSTFESNYSNKLTSDQKSIISGATYTKSGSGAQTQVNPGDNVSQNVANCVAKYDYIVGKYNPTLSSTSDWKDFIDRKPAPVTSGRISLDVLGLTTGNATTIIVVVSIIGIPALGGYIFIRKRKEI